MKRRQKPARSLICLEVLEDRFCLSSLPLGTPLAQPDAAMEAHASAAYGQLPLSFEANQGQTDRQVNFLSRGSGYTLFLTPNEAVLSLKQASSEDVLLMQLVGANPTAHVAGLDEQSGKSNYLIGNDPSQWHTDIVNYGRVEYRNVYAGIDIVYYGNQRQLEYDFIVAPGADPALIRLAFHGVERMSLDAEGNLVLQTAGGDVVEHAPVVYQELDGVSRPVAGRYVLQENGQVGFALGAYDVSQPLTIDPILSYSTYLGGSGNDYGYGIAVNSAGEAYVTGWTVATNFPKMNPYQSANGGGQDVFVTKLNALGTGLVYSTYLGGSGNDLGQGIAIDGAGNAYVAGLTQSANFPTTANAYQSAKSPVAVGNNGFLAKLSDDGKVLLYSTCLGGSSGDWALGVAADGAGKAYVTGWTGSIDFPHTTGAYQTAFGGGVDAFITKLDTMASGAASLVYSTYLGGASYDKASGISVDSSGAAYVTGFTSGNFPIAPAPSGVVIQRAFGGGQYDAFVTKLNAAGSDLDYSTYLGGSGDDVGNAIAVDKVTGEAYVLGSTFSANFPMAAVVNAYQSTYAGGGDAFVSRLNGTGSSLVYSTYLGGSGWDGGNAINVRAGIAVGSAGNAYVTSFTTSSNFPTKNPVPGQSAYHGTSPFTDVFAAKINTSLVGTPSLIFSTYLGGGDDEESFGIALDAVHDDVYVTGETQSNDFPVTNGAFQRRKSGGIHVTEAFVTKISIGAALLAASSAPAIDKATATPLTTSQVQPLLDEAIQRLLKDGSVLRDVDVQFVDLHSATLGLASGNTITLVTGMPRTPTGSWSPDDVAALDLVFAAETTLTPRRLKLPFTLCV